MRKQEVYLEKPVKRSKMRAVLGRQYYSFLRHLAWIKWNHSFAASRAGKDLPYVVFRHQTPLRRQLRNVDQWYQENKIMNLKIAVPRIDRIVIHPGEVFSYWKLIGKPTRRKGYVEGMVLSGGQVTAGVGGGLCQLSNLIFWIFLHSPLTVVERHRHGYDVFPDSSRTQPFGSGATCFYPHGDLMIKNETANEYELRIHVGEEFLEGELRCNVPASVRYEILERNPEMKSEYWGGYSRQNELYRRVYDLNDKLLREEFLFSNHARMMYSPFLTEKGKET